MRIDKFLWCARLYKTRTLAAEAVKLNRVSISGAWVKPSYEVRVGDVLDVRKGQVTFRFRVLALTGNRLPAAQVDGFIENITPQEELDKLNVPRETIFVSRDRGTGRPTKKERREIERIMVN